MGLDFFLDMDFSGFRFHKYAYTFEFSGNNGTYLVSTTYNISMSPEEYQLAKNMNEKVFHQVWDLLESKVVEVKWLDENNVLSFMLNNGGSILIWGEQDRVDNLIVVRHMQSKNWFVLG